MVKIETFKYEQCSYHTMKTIVGIIAAILTLTNPAHAEEVKEKPQQPAVYALASRDIEVGLTYSPRGFTQGGILPIFNFAFRNEHEFPGPTSFSYGIGAGLESHTTLGNVGLRAQGFICQPAETDSDNDGRVDTHVGGGYILLGLYDAIPVTRSLDVMIGGSFMKGTYTNGNRENALTDTEVEAGIRFKF